jgi:hypothetical protein
MSSGWPPEEDDRRWEPVRHASVVGAGHDSRGADRGYSGYARHPADADESGGSGPSGVPPSHDEDGWYAPADPAGVSHPSGPLPGRHGYGGIGGAGRYLAPAYPEADDRGAGFGGTQYEDGPYEDERCGAAPRGEAGYGPAGYGQAHRPGAAHYAGVPYGRRPYAGERDSGEPCAEDGYAPRDLDGGHPGQQAGCQPGGYAGHEAAGYGRSGYRAGAAYRRVGCPRYPDAGDQLADYPETGYPPAGHRDGAHDSRGSRPAPPGQPTGRGQHAAPGWAGSGQPDSGFGDCGPQDCGPQDRGPQDCGPHDCGPQDYGDPRYADPGYGDLAYDDTPYPGSAHRGATQPGLPYADEGVRDTGHGDRSHGSADYPGRLGRAAAAGYGSRAYPPAYSPAHSAVETPGYADGEYGDYPDVGASIGGLWPDEGYEADGYDATAEHEEDSGHEPDPYGPGDGPGYVAAEYASGQFPPGIGAIGALSAGMPDPAATGMLAATGILDSTGISDHVELYDYHPGAAAASRGFLSAPALAGTLDATGIEPPGYLDDPARGDHGIVLDGAEAGDAAGVLEGGSGFFDGAAPAEISAFDLPAGSQGRGGQTGGTGARLRPRPSGRTAGRRRGRSGDRRLWVALGGVAAVFVGAIVAIVMLAFPSGPSGPAHTLVTPNQLNAFTRRPALEQQMNVAQLRQDVVNTSSGQARHVVEAVYEAGNSTSGSTPQIVLFIGGNLLNASPQVSVTSFTQRFKGAKITSAGGLGQAACVNATASQPGSVAMCAWFDNDSFGEVVSPTMNAKALANAMRQIRPHVELVAKR